MTWRRRRAVTVLFFAAVLLAVASLSLTIGQIAVPIPDVPAITARRLGFPLASAENVSAMQEAVVWQIRMPRTLVGLLVGAALGISGAVMQGIFANPLADPGIIGVSAGASAGAVLCIALGLSTVNLFFMPTFAFAGSLFAVALTIFLALRRGKVPVMPLLLAGVAVGMFLGAVTSGLLTFMNEQKVQEYLFWIVGGLDYRRWEHVYMAAGPILAGAAVMVLLARQLNILALGEQEARAVGMRVLPLRMGLLLLASLTTANSVCVSGNIGFVGLVMPHMMRLLVGPDHRILLPASALGGASFLVLCDVLGRIVMPPAELRVGVMTALIGTPYFLFLLRRMRRNDSL